MAKSLEQASKDIAMIHNNIQSLVRVGKIRAVTIELDKLTNIYSRNSDYLNEQIIALQNENAQLKADYESLGEDYSDAQHQIALYEINWPREKDLNRLKADAVLEEKDKRIAVLAKDNRHAVINFVDFCIKKEGLNRQEMEIAFMHFIKSRGATE